MYAHPHRRGFSAVEIVVVLLSAGTDVASSMGIAAREIEGRAGGIRVGDPRVVSALRIPAP